MNMNLICVKRMRGIYDQALTWAFDNYLESRRFPKGGVTIFVTGDLVENDYPRHLVGSISILEGLAAQSLGLDLATLLVDCWFFRESMKTFLRALIIILLAAITTGEGARADVSVVSFQAWKTSRIEETRTALEKLQQAEKTTPGKKLAAVVPKNLKSDPKFQQAQLNLEIAQELTVNDYFILYLSQFNQREAFVEAARKLSPEESADLMMSYQKTMTPPQTESLRSSAVTTP